MGLGRSRPVGPLEDLATRPLPLPAVGQPQHEFRWRPAWRGLGPELALELSGAHGWGLGAAPDLSHQAVGGRVAASVQLPPLKSLTHLDLSDNALGVGCLCVVAAPWLHGGSAGLRMRQAMVSDIQVSVAAESESLAGLRELDLRDNAVDAGLAALAGSVHWGRLESLWLWGTPLARRGVERCGGGSGTGST